MIFDSTVNPVLEALFGNRTAACVLLFLQCYGEGHAQRIAKTFGFGLNMTQRQLKRLEEQGGAGELPHRQPAAIQLQ